MDAAAVKGTRFETNLGLLTLEDPIQYGGKGESFRARCGDIWVVLEMVDDADAVRRRVRAYAQLLACGVPVPRLLDHDPRRGYLVKEYLPGANVGEVLAHGRLGSGVVDQFGDLTRRLRRFGLSLDWSPGNFVVSNGALHYVAYQAEPRPAAARSAAVPLQARAAAARMAATRASEDPALLR